MRIRPVYIRVERDNDAGFGAHVGDKSAHLSCNVVTVVTGVGLLK